MKIFIDTANPADVIRFNRYGIIDGVTTNPALIAKMGLNFRDVVEEMCRIVDGPISAEVVAESGESMVEEAKQIAALHKNVVVKIPATSEGFYALNKVSKLGIKTNFTIIYSANQALLAAKLGATYVSPFVGRLDANSTNGIDLIREIRQIYDNYGFDTKVLAASMRNAIYVKEAALAGADVATIPPEVIDAMMVNELTEISLRGFLAEWDKLPADKRSYFAAGAKV
jgi:transaldolase